MPPRKKPAAAELPPSNPPLLQSLDDLVGDAANPRKIAKEAAAALGKSLERFGDLSGIVWNKQTGELVCGHQRMDQIREKWPDAEIKLSDDGSGRIVVSEDRYFAVRVVDWSKAKQRAANVTANNAKIQGQFTDDLTTFLLECEAEISAELPGIMDEVLLTELLAAGIDTDDATEEVEFEAEISEKYQVLVDCRDEEDQQAVYDQFKKKGYNCRVITV